MAVSSYRSNELITIAILLNVDVAKCNDVGNYKRKVPHRINKQRIKKARTVDENHLVLAFNFIINISYNT